MFNFNRNIRKFSALYLILIAYLFLTAGYFVMYPIEFFPDSVAHLGYINDVIINHFPDYREGLVFQEQKLNYLNHPALYYVLTGELIRLLHAEDHFILFSQGINLIISISIILLSAATLYKLKFSNLAIFLGLSVFIITPIFSELSVSANNDPIAILGCAIFIYGICSMHSEPPTLEKCFLLIVFGGFIAGMSKGTGALCIVCVSLVHFIFFSKKWITMLKNIGAWRWGIFILILAITAGYYLYIFKEYGKLFPAPQKMPAFRFALNHPDAPRWSIGEFAYNFIQYNYNTFSMPYGHGSFYDSSFRQNVIAWILIVTGVHLALFCVLNRKDRHFRLIVAIIISFIIFLAFYFIFVRKLHLETGYKGAMQARYFFGFIPFFAVLFAKTYENFKFAVPRLLYFSLMTLALLTTNFTLWSNYDEDRIGTVIEGQTNNNTTFGELVTNRTFEQPFEAKSEHLTAVDLLLATYARKNTASLVFEILDSKSNVLYSEKISSEGLEDNSWVTFHTNLNGLIAGERYSIRLISPDGVSGNAMTLWAYKNTSNDLNDREKSNNHKSLLDKDAIVDNRTISDASFSYKLYFR